MKALTCRRARKLVQSFLDGELPASNAERVAAHLDMCRDCGVEAETLDQVRQAISDLRPDLVAASTDRVLTRVREQLAKGE